MPNPQKPSRPRGRGRPDAPRPPVDIPTTEPGAEAIFLIMRRMRAPLLFVISAFSLCTAGMMVMPGVDPDGNPYRLNIFDAFYQMTITLTTVGYTEAPYPFSYPQRMWLTMSIVVLVIGWGYAIAVFFALVQGAAFQSAVAAHGFRRQVRRLVDPFVIIAGYGDAGRVVGAELDEHDRRFVVIDNHGESIQSLASGQLAFDVPALLGDCGTPAVLGAAGLGHRHCAGVLALTNDDDANLSAVMTAALLRPDLPVFGSCARPRTRIRMEHFAPGSAINADDRFGDYLALAIHKPVNHQLLRWLMDNEEERLRPARADLAGRRWVVCAQGDFGAAVVADLAAIGVAVELVDPAESFPDVSGPVGFVAGTANDTANIALAEHARQANPDVYLVVRQRTNARRALLDALRIETVYIATDLVAREVLARVLTPVFWGFVEHVLTRDEHWATQSRDHLERRCGQRTPDRLVLTLCAEEAPAVAHWLRRGNDLRLGQLMRRPDDRDSALPLAALVLVRDGQPRFMPDEATPLALGDQVLLVGKPDGLAEVRDACHYRTTVEYLATGRDVPLTWLWSRWAARRR